MYNILIVYILSGEWFVNCFQWFFIIRLISFCFFKSTYFCILPNRGKALTAYVPNKIFFIGWWAAEPELNELNRRIGLHRYVHAWVWSFPIAKTRCGWSNLILPRKVCINWMDGSGLQDSWAAATLPCLRRLRCTAQLNIPKSESSLRCQRTWNSWAIVMRIWWINAIDIENFSRYVLLLQLLMNMISEEAVSRVEIILETGNNG